MELFYHCAAADDDDVDDDMSWVFISHKALVGGIERERGGHGPNGGVQVVGRLARGFAWP